MHPTTTANESSPEPSAASTVPASTQLPGRKDKWAREPTAGTIQDSRAPERERLAVNESRRSFQDEEPLTAITGGQSAELHSRGADSTMEPTISTTQSPENELEGETEVDAEGLETMNQPASHEAENSSSSVQPTRLVLTTKVSSEGAETYPVTARATDESRSMEPSMTTATSPVFKSVTPEDGPSLELAFITTVGSHTMPSGTQPSTPETELYSGSGMGHGSPGEEQVNGTLLAPKSSSQLPSALNESTFGTDWEDIGASEEPGCSVLSNLPAAQRPRVCMQRQLVLLRLSFSELMALLFGSPLCSGTAYSLQAKTRVTAAEADPCETNPCLHGGSCLSNGSVYSCDCLPGYSGENCEIGEGLGDDICCKMGDGSQSFRKGAEPRHLSSVTRTVSGVASENWRGCDHGWRKFHGHCYRYFSHRHTWEDAEKDCREHSAHLASVHSPEEQSFINGTRVQPSTATLRLLQCNLGMEASIEFCLFSNPTVMKLDTEGCDHGWRKFHGHCYRYFSHRHTWEDAEKDCREHSAHLASVHSPEEQSFINGTRVQPSTATLRLLQCNLGMEASIEFCLFSNLTVMKLGLGHENTWIGLNDRTVEEDFQWTDNMALQYENWRENQPDNFFAGGEDCVVMIAHENSKWNDVPCNYNLPYICKKGTVLCGTPPVVENAFLIGRKRAHYDIHSVVRYQCADGFLQRHVPTTKCRSNGKWDRPKIICTKCEELASFLISAETVGHPQTHTAHFPLT
ncbi:UNVERIFIED_CONTAM: hypothetical protein FKN15_059168 [Acipenser sinensis]